MKRVLVTGAGGFVGQALVQRLLLQPGLEQLVAVDRHLDAHALTWLRDRRVHAVAGDSPRRRHCSRRWRSRPMACSISPACRAAAPKPCPMAAWP